MRIIAGTHKGRRLKTPRDLTIRPTADRVREAIFNILGPLPPTTQVLDLFTGTGALSLEALSRGAGKALLLDNHSQAIAIARQNIASLGLESRATLVRWDIRRNLNCLCRYPRTFDLVFMDAPYNRGFVGPTLDVLAASGAMPAGARLVVEHSSDELPDLAGLPFENVDQRRYGKVLVAFLRSVL